MTKTISSRAGLDPDDIEFFETVLTELRPYFAEISQRLFDRFLSDAPELRAACVPYRDSNGATLYSAWALMGTQLAHPSQFDELFRAFGRSHAAEGFTLAHFDQFRDCFVSAFKEVLGARLDARTEAAFTAVAHRAIAAAKEGTASTVS